jgi:hypothetical protein
MGRRGAGEIQRAQPRRQAESRPAFTTLGGLSSSAVRNLAQASVADVDRRIVEQAASAARMCPRA